ncbi:MAG: sortase [Candidatus Saccharibacteria bacterium]
MDTMKNKLLPKIIIAVLVLVGVGLLLYPAYTDYNERYQQQKLKEALSKQPPKKAAIKKHLPTKESFTGAMLDIPKINLTTAVVYGTTADDLMKGPGWYTESALPGTGNTAIAGHHTMYGGPFLKISDLKPGDEIVLKYDGEEFYYKVEKVYKTASTDWSIVEPCGYKALTLSTCCGDRTKRLVVRAAQTGQKLIEQKNEPQTKQDKANGKSPQ